MMSRCWNCGAPTDLELSDVLTKEDMEKYFQAGRKKLRGICDQEKCKEEILAFINEECRRATG